jgi:ABC-2 type transport system permease protein
VAVYERTYHPYLGSLTGPTWRFLVLPRYAFKDVFKSKLFIGFLVACYIAPLLIGLIIYATNNLKVLEFFQATFGEQFDVRFPASAYRTWFMIPQGILSFLMALILGPTLVSKDLHNNALPLYLSRPFSRVEYILGKGSVLAIMISAITWVPGLLLFGLQSYLQGWEWFGSNLRTAFAIFFGCWLLIVLLTTISLALSAYMKWKTLAQAVFFLMFIMTAAFGGIVNLLFSTEWGSLFNLSDMFIQVWASMFGASLGSPVPVWAAWFSVLVYMGVFLALLWRKVQAYEVVR